MKSPSAWQFPRKFCSRRNQDSLWLMRWKISFFLNRPISLWLHILQKMEWKMPLVDGITCWWYLLQDPVAGERWEGVLDGSSMPGPCLHVPFGSSFVGTRNVYDGAEDCLYLNVFTPEVRVTQLLGTDTKHDVCRFPSNIMLSLTCMMMRKGIITNRYR